MTAYYNENNKHAAQWLENLIARGLIPYGHVDNRSIADVRPGDLAGYTQCHFFAGIGGWAHALRLAGWPDDRPIWTGSCPCQPFSQAGKGQGFADARDLWPTWFRLVNACRPSVVMGEQVAGKAGAVWFARTRADLERTAYRARGVVVPACAVGAPHRRERLYFVADTEHHGQHEVSQPGSVRPREGKGRLFEFERHSGASGHLADTRFEPLQLFGGSGAVARAPSPACSEKREQRHGPAIGGDRERELGIVADTDRHGQPSGSDAAARDGWRNTPDTDGRSRDPRCAVGDAGGEGLAVGQIQHARSQQPPVERAGRAFWAGAEWRHCADGKFRRLEPGIALLADGLSADLAGSIAGFGNAIVPQLAAEVIGSYLDTHPVSPVHHLDFLD